MAEKFYNYPGYIEVVGFESMRDQVEDAAQKVIAENNAVDAAQSEKIAQNTESINSEVERSKSADAEFENDLAFEIDERKRMGGILNSKISDEVSVRESADKALEIALNDLNKHVSEGFDAVNDAIEINEQHISAVKEHVEKVHNELSDKLVIEESTRQIKDEELSKAIAEEASIREQNDQAIRDLIDDQKMSRDAIISEMKEEVAKAIAEEASVRENNDQAIRELIDDQKASRDAIIAELKIADEDLARLIKEEASVREEKDAELEGAINQEVTNREELESKINTRVDSVSNYLEQVRQSLLNKISDEASAREEKDEILEGLIDGMTAKVAKIEGGLAVEEQSRIEKDEILEGLIDGMTAKVAGLQSNVNDLIEENKSLKSLIDGVLVKVASLQSDVNSMKEVNSELRKEIEPLKVSHNSRVAIDAIKSLKEGDVLDLVLESDLEIKNERIEIAKGSKLNLNLNGKTIRHDDEENVILFRVNGDLVIEGEGSVESNGYVASVNEGGNALVKSGEFNCSTTCFQSNGGILKIESGLFNAYNEEYKGKYTLNFIDKMKEVGDIEVIGGTFVGYDPSCSYSENPKENFLGEGYKVEEVVVDGISNFTVVKE